MTCRTTPNAVAADDAARMIRRGIAPEGLEVQEALELTGPEVVCLPRGLTARRLHLNGCPNLEALPEDLRVRHLELHAVPRVTELPADLRCWEVRARESSLVRLPDGLRVEFRLDLDGSRALVALPRGLTIGTLVLRGCTALTELPARLDVCFLDLQGCTGLTALPRDLTVRGGHINLADCTALTRLPAAPGQVAQLDLRNCAGLRSLPRGWRVSSWIDPAGSGLTGLPPELANVPVRWRGVAVPERVVFRPETLTVDDVLRESNAEVRRVMLERVGFERFLREANAEVLDADRDPGGPRQLLRLPLPGDEALVCLAVSCPSTGRRYALRVPPTMRSCRQAAAWMAGFDDPDDYHPRIET
jgi:hypothetical protein